MKRYISELYSVDLWNEQSESLTDIMKKRIMKHNDVDESSIKIETNRDISATFPIYNQEGNLVAEAKGIEIIMSANIL